MWSFLEQLKYTEGLFFSSVKKKKKAVKAKLLVLAKITLLNKVIHKKFLNIDSWLALIKG